MATDIRATILDHFLDAPLAEAASSLDLINLIMQRRARQERAPGYGIAATPRAAPRRQPPATAPDGSTPPRRRRRTPEEMEAAGARRRLSRPQAVGTAAPALPDSFVPFDERDPEPIAE